MVLFMVLLLSTLNVQAKDLKKIVKAIEPAVVILKIQDRNKNDKEYGAGFFVSPNGHFFTNYHVLKTVVENKTYSLLIQTQTGKVFRKFQMQSCQYKKGMDACLLKIDYKSTHYLKLNPQKILKGEKSYSLGHPRGYFYSLSEGIVARVFHKNSEQLQVTTPLSPGNSGGPLFNEKGQLLGISTWVRMDKGSQNINFALSANELKKIWDIHVITKNQKNDWRYITLKSHGKKYEIPMLKGLAENCKSGKNSRMTYSNCSSKDRKSHLYVSVNPRARLKKQGSCTRSRAFLKNNFHNVCVEIKHNQYRPGGVSITQQVQDPITGDLIWLQAWADNRYQAHVPKSYIAKILRATKVTEL